MAYEWKPRDPEEPGRGDRWVRALVVAVLGLAIALVLIGSLSLAFTFLLQAPGTPVPS